MSWLVTVSTTSNHNDELARHSIDYLEPQRWVGSSQYRLLQTTTMSWLVTVSITLNHNDELARHSIDYFEPQRWVGSSQYRLLWTNRWLGSSQQRVFWDNDELSNTTMTRIVTTAKTLSHRETAVKSVKPCISIHTWFANCRTFNHEDWKKVLIWWEQQITSKENDHRFFTSGNSYHRDGYVHHRNMSHKWRL